MAWQFSSQQPIFKQIVDYIELDIFGGKYPMGERLPSVRELALIASVNPNTMQRALSELESMGLVQSQRNAGRTVTTDENVIRIAKNEKAKQVTETFLAQMRQLGFTREQVMALLDTEKEGNDGRDS